MIANYYKYGPATRKKNRIIEPWDGNGKWYISENYVSGFLKITADNWAGGVQGKYSKQTRIDFPHPCAPVLTHTTEKAYELVLANVGAKLPKRDSIDARIIRELRTGTAMYGGVFGAGSGIIDSQNDVGGWPVLNSYNVPRDHDNDGMADDWELATGLNLADPNDRNEDFNGDGFTNLEKYLNDMTVHAR